MTLDVSPQVKGMLHIEGTEGKIGARGSVVVKALCYKPEGRGFDSR
jgi:hypothetical protein